MSKGMLLESWDIHGPGILVFLWNYKFRCYWSWMRFLKSGIRISFCSLTQPGSFKKKILKENTTLTPHPTNQEKSQQRPGKSEFLSVCPRHWYIFIAQQVILVSRMETLPVKLNQDLGEAVPAGQNTEGGGQRAQPGLEGVWHSLVGRRRAHLNGGRRRRKPRGSLGATEESVSRVLLSVQDKDWQISPGLTIWVSWVTSVR